MRALPFIVLLASLLAGPAHATEREGAGTHAADVAAIHAVVDQFRAAIIAHDGKTLGSLFLQAHDSWLSVADEAKWAQDRARNPHAPKVFSSSWKKFSESIARGSKPIEERFYNVRVDTNGAVASVWFDFDFLVDGNVTNRGSESWQMVRAEEGWKIGAMLYSEGD